MVVAQPPRRALIDRPHLAPLTQKPAIPPALCDGLFHYLRSGSKLSIQSKGDVMEAWRTLEDGIFHVRFAGRVRNVEPLDTPILLDMIEGIAERSLKLIRRLQASFALDVHSGAC